MLPGLYAFVPLAPGAKGDEDALARVRDGAVWSELVPAGSPAPPMAFRIFTFHFDPDLDATGFVGWLHSHLARATGVGHIVVCGRSARGAADHVRGGIFDYWGCPADAAERVLAEVRSLIEQGRRPRRAHVGPRGACLLCEALAGVAGLPIVAESERAVAVLNAVEPQARGHCVFFPRRHAPRWHDLDDGELAEIATLLKRVAVALGVEDYNLLGNNGARSWPDGRPRPCPSGAQTRRRDRARGGRRAGLRGSDRRRRRVAAPARLTHPGVSGEPRAAGRLSDPARRRRRSRRVPPAPVFPSPDAATSAVLLRVRHVVLREWMMHGGLCT